MTYDVTVTQGLCACAGTLLIVSLVLLVPWNTGGLWAEPGEGQQEPLLEPRGSVGGLLAEMASEDALKADQVIHPACCPVISAFLRRSL